jgi:hypothetical protein
MPTRIVKATRSDTDYLGGIAESRLNNGEPRLRGVGLRALEQISSTC